MTSFPPQQHVVQNMPVREWRTLPPIPSHGQALYFPCTAAEQSTSGRSFFKASLLASLSALDETAWQQTVKKKHTCWQSFWQSF